MKIAIVSDVWFPLLGGGQEHAWRLACMLAQKHGCIVHVYTRPYKGHDLTLASTPTGINIHKIGPTIPFKNIFGRIYFAFLLIIVLVKDRKNFDLIHANAYLPGLPAKIVSIITRKPLVYTVHGTSLGVGRFNSYFFYLTEKLLLTYIRYDVEITVSRDFQKLPNINKKIKYIPTGFDNKNYLKVKRKPVKNNILFVGRLHRQKALDLLIEAINLIKNDIPTLRLSLVGEGEEEERLRNLTTNRRLGNKVLFKGKVDFEGLKKEYAKADVLILPSHFEGSPITLFEAWACAIPVLANKVGEIPYIVEDGVNGYLMDDNKPATIAAMLLKVLKDKKRDKVGLEGRKTVRKYSWERMAEEVYNVYKSLLP